MLSKAQQNTWILYIAHNSLVCYPHAFNLITYGKHTPDNPAMERFERLTVDITVLYLQQTRLLPPTHGTASEIGL